jgi:hypothetical protein
VSGTIVCIGDSITDCDRRTDPRGLHLGRGPAVVAQDGVHPPAFSSALVARLWLATYDSLPGAVS